MSLVPVTIWSDNSGYLAHPRTDVPGPVTALNAVTTVGPSAPVDLGGDSSQLLLSVMTTGTPAAIGVALEGSLDGQDWREVIVASNPAGEARTCAGYFRFIRANLLNITGGSSPTVTAVIAAIA